MILSNKDNQLKEIEVVDIEKRNKLDEMALRLYKQPKTRTWIVREVKTVNKTFVLLLIERYDMATNSTRRIVTHGDLGRMTIKYK